MSRAQLTKFERSARIHLAFAVLVAVLIVAATPTLAFELTSASISPSSVGVSIGHWAALIAAEVCYLIWLRRAARLRASELPRLAYVKGTGTLRGISVALVVWLVSAAVANIEYFGWGRHGATAGHLTLVTVGAVSSIDDALSALVGLGAVVATVGPGYSEYVEALESGRR